ncbi:MAG: HAD family phosphatase [Candidatus Binatia bacterium]
MIKAVLFDLGGVFTDSPFETLRTIGEELDVDLELALGLVFGPYHQDTDHPWHRLERGELSLSAARREIADLAAAHGLHLDLFEILARMGGGSGPRELLVERVRTLRADGYRTGLLTNNIAEFRDAWKTMIQVDELFDVVLDSSEVGRRKPDPKFFELAIERLGDVAPEQCVFLDDFEGNTAAASALGMRAIVVGPDRRAALAELDAILAEAPIPPRR